MPGSFCPIDKRGNKKRRKNNFCMAAGFYPTKIYHLFIHLIVFPPAKGNIADDRKGSKSKIDNTRIHSTGGFLTQLLCCLGTNRALGRAGLGTYQKETHEEQ